MDPQGPLAFAGRWADFTKAFAIYPPKNIRVREALDAALQALGPALDAAATSPSGRLEICFHRGALTFGDAPFELSEGTSLRWLHDRIHKAALAGVAFLPGVGEDALRAFTAHLLGLYTQDTTADAFETLWPDDYPGLDLIDRRFTGAFALDGHAADAPPPTWGNTGGATIDLSREDDLVDRVADDPAVQAALASLGTRLAAVTDAGEETREVDLLARIVRQMPGDVMKDEARIREIAVAALEKLEDQLESLDAAGAGVVGEDVEILRLMFEASQGLLGRTATPDPETPKPPEPAKGGEGDADGKAGKGNAKRRKRRDEATLDDAALFLEELATLPPPRMEPLTPENLTSVGEQVGVCLHYLAQTDETELHPFAQRGLVDLLKVADPASADILHQYFYPEAVVDEASQADQGKLLAALRAAGAARRVRDLGLLAPARIVEAFPREFGLYLDSVDPRNPSHQIELGGIAKALGEARILGAVGELLGREGLLDPYRVERILASENRSMLPFARLLLEHGKPAQKQQTLTLLKAVHPRGDVASLLFLVGEVHALPRWYLHALTTLEPAPSDVALLRRRVTTEVTKIIRDEAENDRASTRRLYAIRQLGTLPTPEAELVLGDLMHARKLGILPREPKAVRQAAKLALRARLKQEENPHVS